MGGKAKRDDMVQKSLGGDLHSFGKGMSYG
jgi:hypothetical protein